MYAICYMHCAFMEIIMMFFSNALLILSYFVGIMILPEIREILSFYIYFTSSFIRAIISGKITPNCTILYL